MMAYRSKLSPSGRWLATAALCIAAAVALPRSGAAQAHATLGLATDLVRFNHPVTQQQCMAQAQTALTAAGYSEFRTDPTAVLGHRAGMTAQVECMSGRGINAAYISVAYTVSQAEFAAHHDPILRGMQM
jgi:hypothetical protein